MPKLEYCFNYVIIDNIIVYVAMGVPSVPLYVFQIFCDRP